MRKFYRYIGIIFLFSSLLSAAQDPGEKLIDWKEGKKLVWDDYKGNIDPSSDAAASTATYLGIEYNITSSTLGYKITCRFSENKSWVRYKSDYILSHEQGHFDITEIFARKLNKLMSEYKFNKDSYRHDLQKIYQDILNEKEEMQNQYDKETDFSRNKEKQTEWLLKIAMKLKELKEFSDYN